MATPLSLTTTDNHCTQSSFFLQKKKQLNKTKQNTTEQKKSKIKQEQIIRKETNKRTEKTKRGFEQQFSPTTILVSYREREREGWVFACCSCCGIGLFPNFIVICLNQNQKTLIGKLHGHAKFTYNLIYNLCEARLWSESNINLSIRLFFF